MDDVLRHQASDDGAGRPIASSFKIRQAVPAITAAALFALSLGFIHEILEQASLAEIVSGLRSLPLSTLAASAAFTALSYVLLLSYDVLALRSSRAPVPLASAAQTGFIAWAFSQTLGFGMLTGTSVRMRFYGRRGVAAADIVGITVVAGFAFWLGLAGVSAVSLLAEPQFLVDLTGAPDELVQGAGVALALAVSGYLATRLLWPGALRIAGVSMSLPGFRTSLLQLALGAADMLASAAALWMLLPQIPDAQTGFLAFAGIYALITIAGYVSHVPGGLGIVEAGMILAFPSVPAESLLASLLAFRIVYYGAPFALAVILLAAAESRPHFSKLRAAYRLARPAVYGVLPAVIAAAVFLGGFVLLVSGAMPALEPRMAILRSFVPLPFVEFSHLMNSLAGFFLLILSVGLYRRLDAAWTFTCIVLCGGIVVSLAKGLDWEEATILAAVLSLAVMGRSAFYRQSSLSSEVPSAMAIGAVGLACGAAIATGFLAFRDVDYSNQLWWQVAYSGDAPRFLRASLMMILAAGGTGAYLMLRPARRPAPDCFRIPAEIPRIVNLAERTEANLALTGDKRFLVAPEGDAFLMYDVQGSSWVVMGDPVGNPARFTPLLWSFREMVDRRGGRAVFYQVCADNLPRYLDLGLTLLKLGEEAIIDLKSFSLEGGARANLRQSAKKAEKQGLSFTVVPAADVPRMMAELAEVSDDWLMAKNADEKRFSVGHFEPSYLKQFDHAVVRHQGRIVAFANIWLSADRREASVDLMRYRHDAPKGHMDYLFVQLLLWAKAQGYERFNLGMAPLSGLEEHPLASAWHKAGNLIFQHGEQIYGFEGLRAFKEKFRPSWHPRYLACQSGLSLLLVLLDVAVLVSRQRRPAPGSGTAGAPGVRDYEVAA